MLADIGVAFVAGLLSCASACVLPLLPAYVAYLGGLSARPTARFGRAALFVAGFTTAFVALGAAAGLLGAQVGMYRSALTAASGVVLVALGGTLLVSVPLLAREWRFHLAHRLPNTPVAAYLVGLTFAAGWTPCVGPILAAVLLLAANATTAGRGAVLLAAYSAGLGLPFLAAGAFLAPVGRLLARLRGARAALNGAAAALLIVMGVLTLTNRLTVLNGFFPDLAVAAQPVGLSEAATGQASFSRLIGRPAPAAAVTDASGRRLALTALRGRPVVVNFWATWCVPCRQELPLFATAAREHRAQGLAVVAIDYQESPEAVRGFWRDLGLDLTPYLDPNGSAARAFGVGLQETGLPLTVLVDRRGTVRSVVSGQVGPQLFASRLEDVLPP